MLPLPPLEPDVAAVEPDPFPESLLEQAARVAVATRATATLTRVERIADSLLGETSAGAGVVGSDVSS